MSSLTRADRADRAILRSLSLIGHSYCIIGGPENNRRLLAQCDDIAWALTYRHEHASDNPLIYSRIGRGRWKPIA